MAKTNEKKYAVIEDYGHDRYTYVFDTLEEADDYAYGDVSHNMCYTDVAEITEENLDFDCMPDYDDDGLIDWTVIGDYSPILTYCKPKSVWTEEVENGKWKVFYKMPNEEYAIPGFYEYGEYDDVEEAYDAERKISKCVCHKW